MQPTHTTVTHAVTPARVLRDAGRYLIEHGWCQSGLFDPDPDPANPTDPASVRPSACALGAVLIAVHGTVEQVVRALAEADYDDATIITEVVEAQVRHFGLEPQGLALDTAADAHDQAVSVLAEHLVGAGGVGLLARQDMIAGAGSGSVVTGWNDAPERIIGHVIAGLYGAADQWDHEHPVLVAAVPVLVGAA